MANLLTMLRYALVLSAVFVCAQQQGRPPNIVLILTDDQDLRMNSLDHMPNVQRLLINEGTSYTRHYAPTALCCPARVSIMTGLHAHNHHVTDVAGPHGGFDLILKRGYNDNYLPIWLSHGGYHTYYTGKLYNGMNRDLVQATTARGWTEADLLVGEHTYQYYNPAFQHIKGDWKYPERVKVFHNHYTTTEVSNHAHAYLKKALEHDKPFFVGIAPVTPHVQTGKDGRPPVPAKKYQGTLPVPVPRAENFNPANRSGVNLVWKLNKLTTDQEKQLDYHYQCRAEALLSVDDMVERVTNTLENAGQLENTYIIYTSDNGFHLGHHRLGAGKKYAFEEDINVPLIIRGPGVPKGRTTDIVSAHVDLAPTIMKMAGLKQRPDFDGKPIAHTAAAIDKQEGAAADEHANIEFWVGASYGWANLPHTPQAEAGRRKKMKVNTYKSVRLTGKEYDIMYAVQCHNNSHELYNMHTDPVQMRNLHPTAPHEKGHRNAFHSGEDHIAGYKIKRLLPRIDALLLVLKSCTREACSEPWKQLHPSGKVHNLKHAMHHDFDTYYHGLPKVHFRKCFKNGKTNLWAEGPQWRPGLAIGNESHEVDVRDSESLQMTMGPKEDDYIDVDWSEMQEDADKDNAEVKDAWDELEGEGDEEELSAEDWERQGYLDDWE